VGTTDGLTDRQACKRRKASYENGRVTKLQNHRYIENFNIQWVYSIRNYTSASKRYFEISGWRISSGNVMSVLLWKLPCRVCSLVC